MTLAPAKRDLLSIGDLSTSELLGLLRNAKKLKEERARGIRRPSLAGFNLAMIFEKPSTRTRTSFEVAMNDLGGHALYMAPKELQLGRGETIADTARVLSRYVEGIVHRAYSHHDVEELARFASVPVINALDDLEHPCQAVADLLTLFERWNGHFRKHRLAYIGDGNNVLNSLMLGSALVGLDLVSATPQEYRPPSAVIARAKELGKASKSTIEFVEDPQAAATGADALYTDVWVSMGEEPEQELRERAFQGYRIDETLLRLAKPSAIVLHDLPAHRGKEITDEVMDGTQAAIWDQAENLLHAQKAILSWLLGKRTRSSGRAKR